MALPPLSVVVAAIAVAAVGVGLSAVSLRGLLARRHDLRLGSLVAIDAGTPMLLRSSRFRLSGRPDVLRRLPDGRVVPVEVKSRPTPVHGPPRSHLAQLAAYCLLLEEMAGVAPPFGVLRYSDGGEFRVRWDAARRRELLAIRSALDEPYDGRATPSRAKCAGCAWRPVCDARAPGA